MPHRRHEYKSCAGLTSSSDDLIGEWLIRFAPQACFAPFVPFSFLRSVSFSRSQNPRYRRLLWHARTAFCAAPLRVVALLSNTAASFSSIRIARISSMDCNTCQSANSDGSNCFVQSTGSLRYNYPVNEHRMVVGSACRVVFFESRDNESESGTEAEQSRPCICVTLQSDPFVECFESFAIEEMDVVNNCSFALAVISPLLKTYTADTWHSLGESARLNGLANACRTWLSNASTDAPWLIQGYAGHVRRHCPSRFSAIFRDCCGLLFEEE